MMSRKRVHNKPKLKIERGSKRKAFAAIGLLLCLIAVSVALSQWKSLRSATPKNVAQETPPAGTASFSSSSPSKEYDADERIGRRNRLCEMVNGAGEKKRDNGKQWDNRAFSDGAGLVANGLRAIVQTRPMATPKRLMT